MKAAVGDYISPAAFLYIFDSILLAQTQPNEILTIASNITSNQENLPEASAICRSGLQIKLQKRVF